MTWLLVVIATINGAASVATHRFGSGIVCNAIAEDLRKQPHIDAAKCFIVRPT